MFTTPLTKNKKHLLAVPALKHSASCLVAESDHRCGGGHVPVNLIPIYSYLLAQTTSDGKEMEDLNSVSNLSIRLTYHLARKIEDRSNARKANVA